MTWEPAVTPDIRGPEDELFDAILLLRQTFVARGLEPPASIELASWEDGMKVLRLARSRYRDRYRKALYGRAGPDEPLTEIEISGITVRWPPKRWARSEGPFRRE